MTVIIISLLQVEKIKGYRIIMILLRSKTALFEEKHAWFWSDFRIMTGFRYADTVHSAPLSYLQVFNYFNHIILAVNAFLDQIWHGKHISN